MGSSLVAPSSRAVPAAQDQPAVGARRPLAALAASLTVFVVLAVLVRYGFLAWADDRGVEWGQAASPAWLRWVGQVLGGIGAFQPEAVVVLALMVLALST